MSIAITFIIDCLLFILMPWLLWRLVNKQVPLAVLPILFGLLIAALGWNENGFVEPSFLGEQIGFIGVLLLAFTAGLEIHPTTDDVTCQLSFPAKRSSIRRLIVSALNALFIPFAIGTVLAFFFFNRLPGWSNSAEISPFFSAMSIGLCIAVSALPVLIGIVRELKNGQRALGNLAIKLAVIDDIVLWIGLASILVLANVASNSSWGLNEFSAIAVIIIMILLNKAITDVPNQFFLWLFALLFLLAGSWATSQLGLHALLGAYFAGAILPSHICKRLPVETIASISLFILAPLFFGHSGLKINSEAINSISLIAAFGLMIVSLITKVGAVLIFPPSRDLSRKETLAVGILLQCKGLMEIVAATILHQQGLISQYAYASLVTLAIISTAFTGPLFRICLNRQERTT